MQLREITTDEAIALGDSRFWEKLTHRERAMFQLHVEKLCMPWEVFHEAVETTLGRPVFTHEFGLNWDGLKAELNGESGPPTLQEIMDLIPAEQLIIWRVKWLR